MSNHKIGEGIFTYISIVGIFLIASIGLASEVYAAKYYVSPSGNNANNGSSVATAWATPNKALTEAVAGNIGSGDTVYLEGGDYPNTDGLYFDFSIVSGMSFGPDYLTFKTLNGTGTAVFDGQDSNTYNLDSGATSYVKIIGPMEFFDAFTNQIYFGTGSSNWLLEGIIAHDNTDGWGIIRVDNGNNLVIRNCEVYGRGHNGIGIGGDSPYTTGNIIEHGFVHDIINLPWTPHGNGIQIPGTDGTFLRYNYAPGNSQSQLYLSGPVGTINAKVYGNIAEGGAWGIKSEQGTSDNDIHDNIFRNNEYGIILSSIGGNDRETVQNNVVYGNSFAGIFVDDGTYAELISNIVYGNTGDYGDLIVWRTATNTQIINPPDGTHTLDIRVSTEIIMDNGGEFSVDGGTTWITSLTTSSSQTIEVRNSTQPLDVYVKAMVNASTPISGATVTLDGATKTTDANGEAVFNSIAPGEHNLLIVTPANGEYRGPGRLVPWRTVEPDLPTVISSTHGGVSSPIVIYFGEPIIFPP